MDMSQTPLVSCTGANAVPRGLSYVWTVPFRVSVTRERHFDVRQPGSEHPVVLLIAQALRTLVTISMLAALKK